MISPDYFATLGTPFVLGREFDNRDTATSPKVAIVNESFARYFFGNAPALGRHVTSVGLTYEIVGVVRDAKYRNLREPIMKTMYISWLQRDGDPPSRYNYLARVNMDDPMGLTPSLERLVREVDPALHVRTNAHIRDAGRSVHRDGADHGHSRRLLWCARAHRCGHRLVRPAGLQVSRRTNELGVRMALGATRPAVIRLILRDVAGMVVAGVLMGAAMALTLSGLAGSMLFGLTPTDPIAFLTAAFISASPR